MSEQLRAGVFVRLDRNVVTVDGMEIVRGTAMRCRYVGETHVAFACPGMEATSYVFRLPFGRDLFHVVREV